MATANPPRPSHPDTGGEFFGLVWPGKDAAREAAHTPLARNFPLDSALSTPGDSLNRIFAADNLPVLQELAARREVFDVIYIDPPYNTGKDFVYRDNYRLRRQLRSGSYAEWHSEWLSMMLPRLILAREVLSPEGFIFVSIGEDEVANTRKVLDEVFGEGCFAGQLIWKKAGTGKNDAKYAVVEHEYILCYARTPDNPGFNIDIQGHTSTKYNHEDDKGKYSLVRLDSKTLGYLPSLDFPISGPDGKEYWPDQPVGKKKVARWRWSLDKVEQFYDELVFRRGFVYTKNYQKVGARPRSILDGERFGVTRTGRRDAEEAMGIEGIFDFPKPVRLIKHLLSIGGGKDARVLDFFAGSGTTAQAVIELNAEDGGSRTFHLAQIPEPTSPRSTAHRAGFSTVADICMERVRKVPGATFQVFKQF